MSNHVKIRDFKRGGSRHTAIPRYRKTRPKTFKTEESAKKWAETNGIKEYTIQNLKEDSAVVKKIKLVY